jgi:hypothetical protein
LSRSTGTPASPGKPPGGSWAARQPPKGWYRNWGYLRNGRECGDLRGGRRMANGRVLGCEKGSAWTMARGLARQNRPPSALPTMPGPSSRVVQKPYSDLSSQAADPQAPARGHFRTAESSLFPSGTHTPHIFGRVIGDRKLSSLLNIAVRITMGVSLSDRCKLVRRILGIHGT